MPKTTDAPPSPEELAELEALFKGMDAHFSESGERRRFMQSASGLNESDQVLLQSVLAGKLAHDAALAGAAAAHSPLRMVNALLELETKIRRSKDKVLLDFIFALLQSGRVAEGLNRTWFFAWELSLVLNKNLTPEQVRFIWHSRKDRYAKELVPTSARVLIKHPQCPLDVLEVLLPVDDPMLRKSIAMHPNASAEIARFFLNSQRKPERLNLALSRHATSEALLSLLRDKHDEVSRAARKNLAQRFPALQVTDGAIQAAIEKNIAKPYVKPAVPKPVFNPWEAARAGHAAVLALDSTQRKRVVTATDDPELSRLLAADRSTAVRREVAKRGSVDLDVLKVLAQDPDAETSDLALNRILRRTPDIPIEDVLGAEALDAAYREIAQLVARNSQGEDYEESLSPPQQRDFARLRLVVEHTNNPLIQLMIVKGLEVIPPVGSARWYLLGSLSRSWNLSEAASRKILVDLKFGGFIPIQHCHSPAVLRELLVPGAVASHNLSTVQERLAELVARGLDA
ncbi:hypothetical protein HNP48_001732 [Acidovorax soli]|uniref:Leucine rich repeat variant n=1 Tax=Acidovorax soli TaxID=592050 RepID=A0A7X0PBW2_9BURK|nr:hypothetical protein [Acidovorax soli]MBB6559068.1 hypothetical protein [Acidovorax soli]